MNTNPRVVLIVLTIYALATIALLTMYPPGSPTAFVQGSLFIGLIWLVKEILSLGTSEAQRLGGDAETWSAAALRRLRNAGWKILDGVPFEGLDVDHVAVSPQGIYAIETKYGSHSWGQNEIGSRVLARALEQSERGARKISLFLKSQGLPAEVLPVLAVWGKAQRQLASGQRGRVSVVVGRDRKDWLRFLPPGSVELTEEQIDEIVAALLQFIDRREHHERSQRLSGVNVE